jgi:hypothetical protein
VKKRGALFVAVCIGLPVLVVGALIIHWFVYPFTSAQPNFADVEAVFSKMVVPETWVKKGEGSNKGIAGRRCPIESDGCFSKVASFLVPTSTTQAEIESVMISMGCVTAMVNRIEEQGGPTSVSGRCSSGAIIVSVSLLERGEMWDMYVNASSR